ncbi:hypothetical protein FIBSPDRAFT_1048680 [Athelia psychrophila]|uniref:Transmembrane protein n=1 Tax=Athelia psychrophila TaxID=1759441 RepID=A0A166DCE1_9AGAM|nr:hypothetical protein FIBSPDRAFT_1048680 [Fibularhizoctonia sp. CBS 109695]
MSSGNGSWLGTFGRAIGALTDTASRDEILPSALRAVAAIAQPIAQQVRDTALRALRVATVAIRPIARRVRSFSRNHPICAVGIIGGLILGGVMLVAPNAVLGIAGFRAVGVLRRSLAARVQSIVYGAFTTGVFASLMSFTMSGAAVPVFMTFIGCVLFVVALFLLWMMLWGPGDSNEGADEDGDNDDGKYKKI